MMNAKPLRILHLEPKSNDAVKIKRHFEKKNFPCDITWVSNRSQFENEIYANGYDVILADFSTDGDCADKCIASYDALENIRSHQSKVPFILLTGSLSEEVMIECMKKGISDLVFKHKIEGLIPMIMRACAESEIAIKAQEAEQKQDDSELLFRFLFESSIQGIWIYPKRGTIFVNNAFAHIFGFNSVDEYLRVDDALCFIDRKDIERMESYFDKRFRGDIVPNQIEFMGRTKDGQTCYIQAIVQTIAWHGELAVQAALIDISDKRAAEKSLQLRERALASISQGIFITDMTKITHPIIYCNDAFVQMVGHDKDEIIGKNYLFLDNLHTESEKNELSQAFIAVTQAKKFKDVIMRRHKDGSVFLNELLLSPIHNEGGEVSHLIGIINDITERKQIESQALQGQKLRAIGQLAAGIAHEINTPTQYVGDNAQFLKNALNDLKPVWEAQKDLLHAAKGSSIDKAIIDKAEKAMQAADFDYLLAEMPLAIEQSIDGVSRIAHIVGAMKTFSHPDSTKKEAVNLNQVIENTVTVCRNEWKYVAELEMDLLASLPIVDCFPQEFSQVILNMLVNAAHAISDKVGGHTLDKGKIVISSIHCDDWVEVRVSDNGSGIPEDIKNKIFDPFFTTKAEGKGTGQGLSMAYASVVERHQGKLSVESTVGQGTTFIIQLPVKIDAHSNEDTAV